MDCDCDCEMQKLRSLAIIYMYSTESQTEKRLRYAMLDLRKQKKAAKNQSGASSPTVGANDDVAITYFGQVPATASGGQ